MLLKRIIPCLDVKDGRVVKGVRFEGLVDAGDPVELASFYDQEGADELVFLDISASKEGRQTMIDVVRRTAERLFIPFTVGGGIKSTYEIKELLRAGADKISLNTQAVLQPQLIAEGAIRFGRQCMVVAIDFRSEGGRYMVYTHGGSEPTGKELMDWAQEVEALGAGEILLTSMDRDGTYQGYDLAPTKMLADALHIPVIASGGAGQKSDFASVFADGQADAALAASLFHRRELTIGEVKAWLEQEGIAVR